MSKRKGLTLIEIIISIALLGIISVSFLGVFGNSLNFLNINRGMTAEVFADQKGMELAIEKIKDDLKNGDDPDDTTTTEKTITSAFGTSIDIDAYQLKYPLDNKAMYTLITDTRLPDFEVPIAENVTATLRDKTTPVTRAYAIADTNVLGSSTIDPDTSDVFMVNNYNWYVSRPGFNMPMPTTPILEIEVGNKYPKFPEDYSLIPTSTTVDLNVVPAYAGRHIVFAVTPAAKSGKMGKTVPSNSVFISGLPPSSANLFLHLDGSVISSTDTNEITKSGSDIFVKNWVDLSANRKDATQAVLSSSPRLIENPIAGDFVGKFVRFDTGKTLKVTHDTISNANLNMFAVVRGPDSSIFYTNGGTSISTSGDPIGGSGDPWKLVTRTYTSSNRVFDLGNTNVDIAELIIYRGNLTVDQEKDIKEYLTKKYMPLETVGEILQLRPMPDIEVFKDVPFTLPIAVTAEMEYGPDKYVPVSWNHPLDVNTSTLGTFSFTATALSNIDKSTTLKVIVKPRMAVTGVTLNKSLLSLDIGDSEALIPTVTPEGAFNKAITWHSSNESVATVSNGIVTALTSGSTIITVKTEDGNKTANCNVTVKQVVVENEGWPKDMILHLDANLGVETTANNVTKWKDQSGYSNDFKGSGGSRPTLVANSLQSMPTIRFTDSHYLTLGSQVLKANDQNLFIDAQNQFSIFMVSKANTVNRNQTFIGKSGGWGSNATYVFGRTNKGFMHVLRGNDTGILTGNPDYNIHTSIYGDKKHSYWLNGTNKIEADGNKGKGIQGRDIVLGATNDGSRDYLRGDIAEVLIFDRALDTSERKFIESYLNDKWFKAPIAQSKVTATDWEIVGHVKNFNMQPDGYMRGEVNGIDPGIQYKHDININTSAIKRIRIRLKNQTTSTRAELYFKTSEGPMDEYRTIKFDIQPMSEFVEYVINTNVPSWSGVLERFRIDPVTGVTSGTFSIDYVRFYD